jgi:hypothetical protein
MVTLKKINAQLKSLFMPSLLILAMSPLAANADLLGVEPQLPLMSISGSGTTTYSIASNRFDVISVPVAFVEPPAVFVDDMATVAKQFSISITLDNNGNLVSGIVGDDLSVVGSVTLKNGQLIEGSLLTGEVKAFGYKDTGTNNDLYDFVFTVSGGLLAEHYAGRDIAVSMNSEESEFSGSFSVDFAGKAKGTLGGIDLQVEPEIELCTLVTLNKDSVSNFSDADIVKGDSCDSLSQGIPVGVDGEVDGTYKLQVTNVGTETLIDAVINAPDFGLFNTPIPSRCGSLEPNEVCIIELNDTLFSNLKKDNACTVPGQITAQAEVTGLGNTSGIKVSDEDPATINCVTEPNITLRKEVKLKDGAWHDANTKNTAPVGPLDADVRYRFVVINDGTEALSNVVINDEALGLVNVPIGATTLLPGKQVILTPRSSGFSKLKVDGFCENIGSHLNTAQVNAEGLVSSTQVSASDVAYVTCKNPQIKLIKEVSIDGINFFDANLPNDTDVPVGLVGETDITYRLTVKNIGTEKLVDVLVKDNVLNIEQVITALAKGETRIINATTIGFESLSNTAQCTNVGTLQNVANVQAVGMKSKAVVTDTDPAYVKCVSEPSIKLMKQVKFDSSNIFKNANLPNNAPKGVVGDSGRYRFIVKNTGNEPLENVLVKDNKLGINQLIGMLAVGEGKTIGLHATGFASLALDNLCSSVGTKLNTAQVSAKGSWSDTTVNDEDPAYVKCGSVPVCSISVDQKCSVVDENDSRFNQDQLNRCKANTSATAITFTYRVKNTGDSAVTITELLDSKLGDVLKTGSKELAPGQTLVRKSKSISVNKRRASFVSVKANSEAGAQCNSRDTITITKAVAANETGTVSGDPHYRGGDGGKWGFHGTHLAMFNLLSDTKLNVNTQYIAARPDVSLNENIYLGNTRIVLGKLGGKIQYVQLSTDGFAQLNGSSLGRGINVTLADGTRISYKKNPTKNWSVLLPSRGQRTSGGILRVWTAEGYYIELVQLNAYRSYPSHLDMGVRTPADGVGHGRMPSGVLGQSFDANNKPLEYKNVNGWNFEVNNLSSQP